MMRAAIVLALTLAPGLALADVIPACPPGTYYVANPPEPGATRPAGGHCTNNLPPAIEDVAPPPGATGTPEVAVPAAATDPSAGSPSAGGPSAGGATDPGAGPGAIVVPTPGALVPTTPAAVAPELGAPVDPSVLGARTAESGEGAAPAEASAPAAVPTAGLCSASVASEGALGLGALFALAALVLRRLRLA